MSDNLLNVNDYLKPFFNVKSMSLLCLGVQTKGCTVRAS